MHRWRRPESDLQCDARLQNHNTPNRAVAVPHEAMLCFQWWTACTSWQPGANSWNPLPITHPLPTTRWCKLYIASRGPARHVVQLPSSSFACLDGRIGSCQCSAANHIYTDTKVDVAFAEGLLQFAVYNKPTEIEPLKLNYYCKIPRDAQFPKDNPPLIKLLA